MVTLKIILPLVWTLGIAFCRPSSMSSSNAAILPGGSVAGKSDAAYNEFVNSDRSDHRAAIALSRFQQVKENLKKRGISANSIKALSYVDANCKLLLYYSIIIELVGLWVPCTSIQ